MSTSAPMRFHSVADPATNVHINGDYFKKHPTWHVEYSPWKANNVFQLMERRKLRPRTVCEVGCGAGEVLRQLQLKMGMDCEFWGYDVAPPAIGMAKKRENERLHFELADFTAVETPPFDLMLILEVVDHVEDYLGFLRSLKHRSDWKLFSFSLDISAQSALRKGAFKQRRDVHSHLHHFNQETALATLEYAGYRIVDYFCRSNPAFSRLARLAKPLRMLSFKLSPDLTVRMFGGYSLIVVAR